MGLIGSLLNTAVTGVKTLVQNAQIGKAAKAQGFMEGLITQGQQQKAVAANTSTSPVNLQWLAPLLPFAIGAGVIYLVWRFILKPLFK